VTAAWMVHTTRFARDLLEWNGGGSASLTWACDLSAIAESANADRSVTIPCRLPLVSSGIACWLREWRMHCTVEFATGFRYDDLDVSRLEMSGVLPETLIVALSTAEPGSGNSSSAVSRLVQLPNELSDVVPISVANVEGAIRVELDDDLVPLAAIPGEALRAVIDPGPFYAPWHHSDAAVMELGRLLDAGRALCRNT